MRTRAATSSRWCFASRRRFGTALTVAALTAAIIPIGTAAAQDAEPIEVTDVQLTWAYSQYAQHGVFGPWRQWTDGDDVAVTMAGGEEITGLEGEAGRTYLLGNFDGGSGTIDPDTGEGTISWDTGDWVINAYPEQYGAPDETYSDPVLSIGPDGSGELNMVVFIPEHDDFLHGGHVPAVGPERRVIATFSGVELSDDGMVVNPDFAGRSYDPGEEGSEWLECDGAGGSWPTGFIDFLPVSVRAHYYTTSCAGLNLLKPPLPFEVSWAEVAPEIVRQPAAPAEAIEEGRPLEMEVWVTGTPTPAVQWQRSSDGESWTDVSGGTGARYPLNAAVSDGDMQFRAMVSNAHGSVTSEPTETVAVIGEPAAIAADPQSRTFGRGDDAFVRVWVTGAPWPTVTWERSDDDGITWQDATGDVGVTTQGNLREHRLIVPSVTDADDDARFRAVVTNGYEDPSPLVSDEAVLSVVFEPPEVTRDPEDALVYASQTAVFRADGEGLPAVTYQWETSTDDGATWSDWTVDDDDARVAGTDRYLEIPDAGASLDGRLFRLRVDNDAGAVHTEPARLTVATPAGDDPEVTVLTDGPIDPAQETTILVAGTGFGSDGDRLRAAITDAGTWEPQVPSNGCGYRSLVNRTFDVEHGGFNHAWTIAAGELEMTEQWGVATCRLDDDDHSVDTWTPLEFIDLAPQILRSPQDQEVGRGDAAAFSVDVAGYPWPSVQWQRSEDEGQSWSDIDGATGATYTMEATTDDDDGAWFRVAAANGVGEPGVVYSGPGELSVQFAPPVVVQQPVDELSFAGQNATFAPVIEAKPEATFRWERSDDGGTIWSEVDDPAGSLMALSFTPQMSDDGAVFRLRTTNAAGEVVTDEASLTVVEPSEEPSVVVVPADPIDPEVETTVTVLASGFDTDEVSGDLRIALVDSETWQPGQDAITEGWVAGYDVRSFRLGLISDGTNIGELTIPAGALDPASSYGVAAFSDEPGERAWDTWTPLEVLDGPSTGDQEISVTVPDFGAGEFVLSVFGDSNVDLGEATDGGGYLQATGHLDPIFVTDTRTGEPEWSISGQVSDFADTIPGAYLGWTPEVYSEGAGAVAGDPVASGIDGGNGLSVASTLASADAGHEPGTGMVWAHLDLRLPVETDPGSYTATLTITALS